MLFKYFTCLLILLFSKGISSSKNQSLRMHREPHMTVKLLNWNPKYLHYANMTTKGGYTVSWSTKYPMGNNVTTNMIYETLGPQRTVYKMTTKICDLLFKWKWAVNFMSKVTDGFAKGCPMSVGEYHLTNMQLIPKYSPFMDPKTDYDYTMRAMHTTQKDNIITIIMMNRLRNKQKS